MYFSLTQKDTCVAVRFVDDMFLALCRLKEVQFGERATVNVVKSANRILTLFTAGN
jgi:hypothetical protein